MRGKYLAFLAASLLLLITWGCGSSRDSDGSQTSPNTGITDAQSVGSDSCKVCHTLAHTTEINGLVGQISPNALEISHSCEACHGGGQFHRGVGPIPYPAPDSARCATCHSEQVAQVVASKHNAESGDPEMIATGHQTGKCQRCHTAEGSIAFAGVIGTKTAYDVIGTTVAALPHQDASGNNILHNPTCAACHDPLKASLRTVTGWDPNGNAKADEFDLCTSCHVYQNGSTLFASGNTYTVSTGAGADGIWFTADDTKSAGTATDLFYHNTAWYRIIASTHFDNPDSPSVVEGYVVRKNGANPCFDCHGHELHTNTRFADTTEAGRDATPTIYTDWAQSAHAGGLLANKYAVARTAGVNKSGTATLTDTVMGVGVTDTEVGDAWVHYDWDKTYKADGADADTDPDDDRAGCQMCHTATGAANFMTDPIAYNPINNDFTHLSGWVGTPGTKSITTGSPQNELLYCWGCHTNAGKGELRTPGAITLAYTVDGVKPTLPDMGASNVCINCHGGRGNMDSLVAPASVNPATATTSGTATKTHYMGAAQTIFQAQTRVGYQYPGLSYANPSYYAHNTIGCAECHMNSENSHSFGVVEKDGTGAIVALKSETCIECHDGEHGPGLVVADTTTKFGLQTAAGAAAFLEEEAEGFHEALEILNQALIAKGINFVNAYPYFTFTVIPGVNDGGNWINQGNYGAAHNYNYLHHEPGAYAHNRYYAKRLIFDSIDWVDNFTMNGSITIDAVTYPEAALWLGADGAGVATRP